VSLAYQTLAQKLSTYPRSYLRGIAGVRRTHHALYHSLPSSSIYLFFREQAPKEHGTSDVSVLVNVTLPSSAIAALVLEQQEYRAAQMFTLHDILNKKLAPSDVESLSPSLVKLYSDYGGFRFHPAGKSCSFVHARRM
jgi:hypothetical protein